MKKMFTKIDKISKPGKRKKRKILIRVLEIPKPTGNLHFQKGEVQEFIEVDWFKDDVGPTQKKYLMHTQDGRDTVEEFIRGKKYFDPKKAYLVLHQSHTFTINYTA